MSVSLDEPKIPEYKQQAIDWLVRLRADDLTEEEISVFAVWLAQDYLNSEAFAFAEDLFDDMVCAADLHATSTTDYDGNAHSPVSVVALKHSPSRSVQKPARKHPARRIRWLSVALTIAAVWLFAVILVMPESSHPLDRLISDYHTETGELRDIQLADGSQLLLNTNSAVTVDYDESRRHITVLHGQVRFTVAKDSRRPFDVNVDELNVRALGTVFEVYRSDAKEVSVTVQQHAVSVQVDVSHEAEQPQYPQANVFTVLTGQTLLYRQDGALPKVEQIELDQATAWQQHRLFINDRPLGDLIFELNRYRIGRIFLSDQQLRNLRVTGVFSLDNPDDIVRAVSEVLNLQETRLGPLWVLLHR